MNQIIPLLERGGNVSDLLFGEIFAGGLNLVEQTTVDPRGTFAASVDSDALLAEGDIIGRVILFDVIIEKGVAIPGGLFF